jgi:hypothetical protein
MSDFYIAHECEEMKEALERGWLVADDEDIDNKGNCHIVSLPGNAPCIRYCPWCGEVVSNLCTSTCINLDKRESCQLMRNSLGDITPYPEKDGSQIIQSQSNESADTQASNSNNKEE